tara:strand:+ start:87 stop:242 length:156 start_codon:yes stop_codon:yes gene_type:complete
MKTETGIKIKIIFGHVYVKSDKLKEEPIYNEVTLDTALRNQLKSNLIKLSL